jgi:hypothetical protein
MIDAYRPLIGRRRRAEGWSLPSDFEAVSPTTARPARVRDARSRGACGSSDCALGSLPPLSAPPHSARAIALEANRLFEFPRAAAGPGSLIEPSSRKTLRRNRRATSRVSER